MSVKKSVSINPGTYPVLRIALIYAGGIVAGRLLPSWIPAETFFLLFTLIVSVCVGLHFLRPCHTRYLLLSPVYLLCLLFWGTLNIRIHDNPSRPEEQILHVFDGEKLTFSGAVLSARETRSGHQMIRVAVDSVQISNLPTWKERFVTESLVRSSDSDGFAFESDSSEMGYGRIAAGSYLRFRGDLQLPSPPRNPNQFDYASFLKRQGIHTQVFVSEILDIGQHRNISFWLQQQIRVTTQLDSLFSGQTADLAKAILLGDRSNLDPDLRTAFSRAGLAHLMAVSGMHVGFILLPVWFILPWFRGSRAGKLAGLTLGAALLFLYAGITGFSVSVSRASIMAFFIILARLFHKPGTSMNIIGAAAFLLLIQDPIMLFDIGFQLSFLAVIIILTTLPGMRYLLPPTHRYRTTGTLFQFVMVSVLVQGGLYPVLMYYFQEFSIAGPLSNTLAVPFVQVMFLWAFFCLGLALFHSPFAALLNTPGDMILKGLTSYVTQIGSSPAAWISGTLSSPWVFGIWFFAISLIGSMRLPAIRWKMAIGLLIFLFLYQADQIYDRQLRHPDLRITFFDVGQGDATLLQTPGGRNYLYDTGVWTPRFNSGERVLIPELNAMGIRKLDGIILSHPHADHIGGIISLMKAIPIDTIYQSPLPYDSRLFHNYMKLADDTGIPVRLLTTGDMIYSDTSAPMMVMAPSNRIAARDANNHSVVIMAQYGENRILLAGDAEEEAESFLVDTYGPYLHTDLLKIGHHASRTSSTTPFLRYLNAQKGVASLALHNRYNHPHPEAVARLHKAGVSTRFTSIEGALIFRCNGIMCTEEFW